MRDALSLAEPLDVGTHAAARDRPVAAARTHGAASSGIAAALLALAVVGSLATAFVAWTHVIDLPPAADRRPLDLRARAAAGDREALIQVFRQRVESPDGAASRADPMETLYWAERAWAVDDADTRHRLGGFIDRHCDDPRVGWHWLCDPGE